MNRRQRRACAKKGKVSSSGLQQAGNQIESALEALREVRGLEGTVERLGGLDSKIDEARQAMEDIAKDVQVLAFELQVQREVSLRLLARIYSSDTYPEMSALDHITAVEADVRESLVKSLVEEQADEKG